MPNSLKDRRVKLDLEIAELAISRWTAETSQGVRPTDEGREILAYRTKALSDKILERQCLTVSPEYAEEAFSQTKKGK